MDVPENQRLANFLAVSLRIWASVTTIFVVGNLALLHWLGRKGLASLIQEGPASLAPLTLVCVAIVWLAYGLTIALLCRPQFRAQHGLCLVLSLLVLLLYVNVLRERARFGDVGDYVTAAANLHDGQPFHDRYIYPPLLATLCQPILPLGKTFLGGAMWFANIISLVAFFWLLTAVLVEYGFGRETSSMLVFLFMVINVPIIRTLGYVQVNLHVVDLILASMLLFPRYSIASALALALAVHLKASPIVLALPFLLTFNKRWLLAFVGSLMCIAAITYVFYGLSPFSSFLHNVGHIYAANGIWYRENSIDSLVRSTAAALRASPPDSTSSPAILLLKIPLLCLVLATATCNVRRSSFLETNTSRHLVFNSLPAMLTLMVLASPLVWEHHCLLLALPFFLVLKTLATPGECAWYTFAYVLAFMIPTFDFYPWSFGRLASVLILTILLFKARNECGSAFFLVAQERLQRLWSPDTGNQSATLLSEKSPADFH